VITITDSITAVLQVLKKQNLTAENMSPLKNRNIKGHAKIYGFTVFTEVVLRHFPPPQKYGSLLSLSAETPQNLIIATIVLC